MASAGPKYSAARQRVMKRALVDGLVAAAARGQVFDGANAFRSHLLKNWGTGHVDEINFVARMRKYQADAGYHGAAAALGHPLDAGRESDSQRCMWNQLKTTPSFE